MDDDDRDDHDDSNDDDHDDNNNDHDNNDDDDSHDNDDTYNDDDSDDDDDEAAGMRGSDKNGVWKPVLVSPPQSTSCRSSLKRTKLDSELHFQLFSFSTHQVF